MPMVRSAGPPEHRNHALVTRTESLKSERSDKRVSFNKDVGVKHIPRGQKTQQPSSKNNIIRTTTQPDEWANCAEVYLEPVTLSSHELEQQAEEIVKLIDNVNCDTASNTRGINTRSLDRPVRNKNKRNVANQNNNVLINNVRNNNNKNNNIINGETRGRPRTLPNSRTANQINRGVKGDINRVNHSSPSPIPNGGPLNHHRHRSVDHLNDTDFDSPSLTRRNHHLGGHKSVPDLNTVYYDNSDAQNYEYRNIVNKDHDANIGYKSVDNLYESEEKNQSGKFGNNKVGYKSVDNLAETNQVSSGRLKGFKSVGHLPSVAISDSDTGDMSKPKPYKPKVENIIKKFNQDAEEVRRYSNGMDVVMEMDTSPRGTLEPDRFHNHNNNKPFSYTGSSTLASVQAVRRLSPPRQSPLRESPPRETPVYAQVNKRESRTQSSNRHELTNSRNGLSNSRNDLDRNYRNSREEREYSAKIIITDRDDRSPYEEYNDRSPYRNTLPKNHYQEDDDAYESYQVPEDNIRRLIHEDLMSKRMLSSEDLLEEYKELSNNNINMSSIGVQTDALPKAPSRLRKTSKSPGSSPTRQLTQQSEKQYSQRVQQNQHIGKQEIRHQQITNQQRNQEYGNHRSRNSVQNNLTSASLVRQVNHGFGRTDRSPSPPPRVATSRQPKRNVVPLLSDTSDSEAEHRRKPIDPLAKIRDQVMLREKLQEEEEEEEEARHGRIIRETSPRPYKTEAMTPLTIDEIDKLSLVMEDTGGKKLRVSNNAKSSTATHLTSHRSRRIESISEERHTHNSRDRNSLPRPQKPPREKNHIVREPTPTREKNHMPRDHTPSREKNHIPRDHTPTREKNHIRDHTPSREKNHLPRDPTPTRKEPTTLERNKKNNLEKERASKVAKQKEEKKEKKKKRIKIKFFYDPRPQDDPNVDPLARFQEFRGSSSEERASPSNDREDQKKIEHSEEYHNERVTSHRREYHDERDEYRQRRDLPDVLEDTTTSLKERRSGSRDHLDRRSSSRERLDSTPRPSRHGSRELLKEARSNHDLSHHESFNGYNNKRRDSKDSRDSRDNRSRESRSRSRDDHISYNESTDERRKYEHNERSVDRDYSDNDERGSPDGRPGRSLSDKYKSAPLYDPPEDENTPAPEISPPAIKDEETKTEKIMRQRKRFFSVLRSDGRASSPQKSTSAPPKIKVNPGTPPVRTSNKKGQAPSHPDSKLLSPTPNTDKAKDKAHPPWYNRDKDEVDSRLSPPPSQQWESSTLSRAELRTHKESKQEDTRGYSTTQRPPARKYSAESSASSGAPPPSRVARTTSFKHRYFGDTDIESNHGGVSAVPDYRSLPNRASRSAHKNVGKGKRITRGMSPPVVGSAGSSLQSSESEVDSHQGSHVSRASKASHISTGSNRSVYLHATAVADIPVQRGQGSEVPSERGVNRSTKKVSRSFSVLAPWKPRHYREKYEVDYENDDVHEGKKEINNGKGALPPKPPRRLSNDNNDKKVNRSQSMYKDSRLAGWLRRRRHKEAKGI